MSAVYTARSLTEIAEWFESNAAMALRRSTRIKRDEVAAKASAAAWTAAATMLRKTQIVADPPKKTPHEHDWRTDVSGLIDICRICGEERA